MSTQLSPVALFYQQGHLVAAANHREMADLHERAGNRRLAREFRITAIKRETAAKYASEDVQEDLDFADFLVDALLEIGKEKKK